MNIDQAKNTCMEAVAQLPNGYTLYREPNEAGWHRYWSDEISGGVVVWDTCLVGCDTLLAAVVEEKRRMRAAALSDLAAQDGELL